ncbi:hypothetical protein JCM9157_4986 [Halalkalibacter akibai JCM 9157]|uniref:Lipoprotein n=2 Tax=Halalkalibacter akibai TaxID=1411 RepID=W4R288_HALA3|nr:hypothetical protein JCM9157_4986 [Halalkalibacter akibai JCM 9157]
MKKGTIALFLLLILIAIGCSQKYPYAMSEDRYNIFYIAPEDKDDEHFDYFQWFTDFHEENTEVGLLVYDLHLTQETYPSLKAKEAPYFYVLDKKRILLETTDFEEIRNFLVENIK